MSGRPFPKWKCEQIAHDVTRTLNLSPALHWTQVREFYTPRLPGMADPVTVHYEEHKRPLIVTALNREFRYHHARVS